MRAPYQILCIGRADADLSTSAFGPFVVSTCDRLEQAALTLRELQQKVVVQIIEKH